MGRRAPQPGTLIGLATLRRDKWPRSAGRVPQDVLPAYYQSTGRRAFPAPLSALIWLSERKAAQFPERPFRVAASMRSEDWLEQGRRYIRIRRMRRQVCMSPPACFGCTPEEM